MEIFLIDTGEIMSKKVLVFYDAQNMSKIDILPLVEKTICKYGEISSIRIYHDFVGKDNRWKKACFEKGYMPCQITKPKNNTADLLISIDAMKSAFNSANDIYCFVSNDSDFGPISLALRELGKDTLLITSLPDNQIKGYFTYLEIVNNNPIQKEATETNSAQQKAPQKQPKNINETEVKEYLLHNYSKAKKDKDGWASYSTLCQYLKKKYEDSDFVNLGYKSKRDFILKSGFEIHGSNYRKVK